MATTNQNQELAQLRAERAILHDAFGTLSARDIVALVHSMEEQLRTFYAALDARQPRTDR